MAYPQETKEAVVAFLKIAVILAEQFKDGVQASDIGPILVKLQEEPLKSELVAAYNGVDKVKDELKEVKLVDVLALIPDISPEIIKLVEAVKK